MRNALVVLALITSACGPGRTAFARYPGAATAFDRTSQDAKALAIADQALTAAGGGERWSAAKQLRWSQAVTLDGKPALVGEQAWDRWNGRHHGRAKRGEDGDIVVMRHLYDELAHAYMDTGTRMKKMEGGAPESIAAAKDRWEFDTAILFMPFLLEEPGTKLSYEGEAQDDKGEVHDVLKVQFDPKDGTRTATYVVAVDRDSHRIVRFEIQRAGKGDNERLGYAVTQWLESDGITYPSTVENIGLKGEVVTFKDLDVGTPDDDLYVPPL